MSKVPGAESREPAKSIGDVAPAQPQTPPGPVATPRSRTTGEQNLARSRANLAATQRPREHRSSWA